MIIGVFTKASSGAQCLAARSLLWHQSSFNEEIFMDRIQIAHGLHVFSIYFLTDGIHETIEN